MSIIIDNIRQCGLPIDQNGGKGSLTCFFYCVVILGLHSDIVNLISVYCRTYLERWQIFLILRTNRTQDHLIIFILFLSDIRYSMTACHLRMFRWYALWLTEISNLKLAKYYYVDMCLVAYHSLVSILMQISPVRLLDRLH